MRPLALLDLDGTLTDSAPGILGSVRDAYTALGVPVPSEAQLRTFLGPPIAPSFAANGVPAELVDDAVSAYRASYDTGMLNTTVYPGIVDALIALRAAGVQLVVATSKPEPFAVRICTHLGLSEHLDAIAGASFDQSRSTKADVITHALSLADPDGDARVMVGDRRHDVLGAAEHGIDCIGAGWGYAPDGELAETGAVAVLDSPDRLPDAVLALIA